MPKSKDILSWLLPIIGISVGIIGLGIGSENVWHSLKCESWPHTDGVIRTANIERETSRRYHASISYNYEVDHVPYTSTRIAFEVYVGDKDRAQNLADRYSVGQRVQVFYSPTHPEDAVLEPGIFGGTWTELGVGGGFFTIGGVLLVTGRKRPNSRLGCKEITS